MANSRKSRQETRTQRPSSILILWLFRILVPLGGYRAFVTETGLTCDELAQALGVGHWVDPFPQDFDGKKVVSEIRMLHKNTEYQFAKVSELTPLQRNVERIDAHIGIGEVGSKVLEFIVMLNTDILLFTAMTLLGRQSIREQTRVLSVVLDFSEQTIRASLNGNGKLQQSGLVKVYEGYGDDSLLCRLKLLSEDFADLMVSGDIDPTVLLSNAVSKAGSSHLSLADYKHIDASINVLRPYLVCAVSNRLNGVNIFLHGAPGTGKSQLARALATELGYDLFEIAWEDSDGNPINGESRLRAYRAAQMLLTRNRTLIAFDEAEDVFNDGDRGFGRKSTAQLRKAWVNRMLEENQIPTIWLSNSINSLDPAFIRRFDMVIEIPVPPKKQREQILQKHCGDLLDARTILRIAEVPSLAPAVVARAGNVVRLVREDLGPQENMLAFETLISNTLEAQGHGRLERYTQNQLPDLYDPTFINANEDLARVATGLTSSRSGRLCLYGPPGTGKTAYGHWLAGKMGMPLHVKRASDLMSMMLGETERNLAKAFREAEHDNALLLIDEVDSFLQDRRGAQKSWEISQVNEMLTQMESFPGIFIASTNLVGNLDQAALRRFDLKVKFDFLRPEQAQVLLVRHCARLSFAEPNIQLRERVARQKVLTPGDFAAVLRQHRFKPLESAAAFVAALESECMLKGGGRASIGFL